MCTSSTRGRSPTATATASATSRGSAATSTICATSASTPSGCHRASRRRRRDHGYDVADYFDIEPKYGTLDDFDRTLADAKERGIRIMLDIVPNHCSSDHAWFQAALKAAPGSPERARYWFKDGKGPNGDEPPNNWRAIFGGPAWTRVTEADGTPGQWYVHTFTPGQPDFNWYNQDVIDYFDRMLTFWFDRGVEGIRVDAVPVLGKHPDMPDSPPVPPGLTDGQRGDTTSTATSIRPLMTCGSTGAR